MKNIIIENLCKSYGGRKVLDNFSAEIRPGEVICIMGPSGCGKTTLLNILMGFEKADSGSVSGVPALKSAVFQEDRLCEEFSAAANIRLATGKSADENTIKEHLKELGLDPDEKKPVKEFSGGMKRRIAIIRAVLFHSDILFLDEPFKGLDGVTRKKVIDYVLSNADGRTIIAVTHEQEEYKLLKGRLIEIPMLG